MAMVMEEARASAEAFIQVEAKYMVPLLFRGTGLHASFKPGAWWTADTEKNVTYDPSSFSREGMNFSPVQQLFALCHELYAHLAEYEKLRATQEGEEMYQAYLQGCTSSPAINQLENHMQDTRGNRGLLDMFAVFKREDAIPSLYDKKLFPDPNKNMRKDPKHLQFGRAILLEYMLSPKDRRKIKVNKKVEQIIHGLRDGRLPSGELARHPVSGEPLGDVIELITNEARTNALESMRLRQAILWPIVTELYQEDVKERRLDDTQDPFKAEYEKAEKEHVGGPHSEDEKRQIDEATRSMYSTESFGGGKGGTGEGRREKGATPFEAAWRATDPYVRELAKMLADTIEDPALLNNPRFFTRPDQEEGELEDMVEIYKALRRRGGGSQELRVYEDEYMVEETHEELYQQFAPLDFYFVVDTTGSMRGDPIAQAAKAALLLTRAAVERKKIAEEAGLEEPATQIAVHIFDTNAQIILPLREATTLDKQVLEHMFQSINSAGGGNNEPRIFENLAQDLQEHQPPLDAPRKRIIFIITDGGATGITEAKTKLAEIREMDNVRVVPIGINAASDYFELYGKNAPVCTRLEDVLQIVAQVLGEEMKDAAKAQIQERSFVA